MRKILSHISRITKPPYRKKIIFSLISALILIISSYFANNSPLFTGEIVEQYYSTQKVCSWIGIHRSVNYGDIAYYNVSYDKELIPAKDKNDTIGYNVITDRHKLTQFLNLLKRSNKYKYIILDLVFDNKDVSKNDSELLKSLEETPRLVFVTDENICTAFPELHYKSANASYYITLLSTSFSRYEFSKGDKLSIPLHVYLNIHKDDSLEWKQWGKGPFALYFLDGHLAQNTNYLTFDNTNFNTKSGDDSEANKSYIANYVNVGTFLSNEDIYGTEGLIDELDEVTKDKIVIISNLTSDVHDTYMGDKPGALILARALQTIEEGKLKVSFLHSVYWFCLFFLITLFIIEKIPFQTFVPFAKKKWHMNNASFSSIVKFGKFLLSIITFSLFLWISSIFDYVISDRIYSISIPIIYFTLLKLYTQFKQEISK